MAVEYTLETHAQPSLYDPVPRKLTTYFSLPERSQGRLSGLLLMISGFGGHANSNVFKKMRNVFADEYDLITISCDFFGYEFMLSEPLPESPSNFCDMGPVQAMDLINSVKSVSDYCHENNIEFDETNVIAYGFSHGGYLAYLMNALMPGFLSCIIDNSAWIYPGFIQKDRALYKMKGDKVIDTVKFQYLIGRIIMDPEIYSLELWSNSFANECRIISFHCYDDELALFSKKSLVLSRFRNSSVEIIGEKRIDGTIFKNNAHGLGADFLDLFRYVMKRYDTHSENPVLQCKSRNFETNYCKYHIDVDDIIPLLTYQNKEEYDFENYCLVE